MQRYFGPTIACVVAGALCARVELGARPQAQDVDHSSLAGEWRLDESASKLSAENWRKRTADYKPLAPCLPTLTRPGEPVTYDCGDASKQAHATRPNAIGESALSMFGRPLLDASPTLIFAVGNSSVTIGGELLETRTFATTGKPETIDVIVYHSVRRSYTRPARFVTRWVGASLVQEKKGAYSGVSVAATQTYLPTADGRQLFVLIDVTAPKLTPPVKPIRRVYVRDK